MSTKTTFRLTSLLIFVALCAGLFLYQYLPFDFVTHWGPEGIANGTMSKLVGILFTPAIATALATLLFLLPKIDPMKNNIDSFRKEYNRFILSITIFFVYVQGLLLVWNMGFYFSMPRFIAPAIGLLFLSIAYLLGNTKRNFFVGIRTPWTLSSDGVWEKTNKAGAHLFQILGVLGILSVFALKLGFALFMVTAVLGVIWLFYFSYQEFQKEKQ